MEPFPKTQINNHGNDEHGGIIWEWDPVRHRKMVKQLSPAFSGRALRAKEPALHRYIDLFVERMKGLGGGAQGVSLPTWINWLCVDVSADMAYNRQMNALKDSKSTTSYCFLGKIPTRYSETATVSLPSLGFQQAIVVIQMSWRFPILSPLKYLFLLFTAMRPHSHIRDHSRQQLEQRIRRKGAVEHLDFFEQLIPEDREPPKDRKEMRHLSKSQASCWGAFESYSDITSGAAAALPYLTACLKESLRVMPNVLTGMPVVSPGAMVDGTFIPKGVICQSSPFALARSPCNFCEPLRFRPERWLPEEHPLYDTRFGNDDRKGFHPFSQDPRMCAGKEIAWWQNRVFIAKVLWTFDLEMVSGQHINMDRDLRGWDLARKGLSQRRLIPAAPNLQMRTPAPRVLYGDV
ncbi:hypothetical protein DL770_004032 [Monosporascus sp. CRB-9-2]|nr:hypothetical protein DL770_004032 [Monosporascus sp. CRB-9-2]